jgi:hypothetical protein
MVATFAAALAKTKCLLGFASAVKAVDEGQRVAVNSVAESILRRKALEEALTPAAPTISIPRERTTADLRPLEFANAKGVSVNPPRSDASALVLPASVSGKALICERIL